MRARVKSPSLLWLTGSRSRAKATTSFWNSSAVRGSDCSAAVIAPVSR